MRLGVVEWHRQRIYLICYSDCNDLIREISNHAYANGVQKKLFGNWSSDYQKICNRANKIFRASVYYYAPFLLFIGEYDSEDINEVYKVELLQKEQEDNKTHMPCNTCAFYITGSKESDATVVSFYNGAIVPSVARDKDGKEKRIDEGELATIRALIKTLDPFN